MENIPNINNFVNKLKRARSGDLSGWMPVYITDGGLCRYVLRDDNNRFYDAYAYGGRVHIYDPDMRLVVV